MKPVDKISRTAESKSRKNANKEATQAFDELIDQKTKKGKTPPRNSSKRKSIVDTRV